MKYRLETGRIPAITLSEEQFESLAIAVNLHRSSGYRDGRTDTHGVNITEVADNPRLDRGHGWRREGHSALKVENGKLETFDPNPIKLERREACPMCNQKLDSHGIQDAKNAIILEALQSIARNSCCSTCQEAGHVARQALKDIQPK